jgi:serine/threonine protein kinase
MVEVTKVNNQKKLESLKKKHVALDNLLRQASTDAEVRKIKGQKLSIKDQLTQLASVVASADAAAAATRAAVGAAEVLGAGTSGKVFHGTHSLTRQTVAVKTAVDAAQQADLRREFLVLEKLSNEPLGFTRPHFFGHQVVAGQKCSVLVMDLLGPSVEALLFAHTLGTAGFSPPTVLQIARESIKRLETLHRHGLCHSDVHPGNLLLGAGPTNNRTVHLIDFGRARPSSAVPRGSFRGAFDSLYSSPSPSSSSSSFASHPATDSTETALPSLLFASSDVLAGRSPRPRDDLESLLFCLASLSAGSVPEGYWGRSRAEAVRAKAGQAYSVRELLHGSRSGDSSSTSSTDAVERLLESIRIQVRRCSLGTGEVDYSALLAQIDAELGGPGCPVLDWEAAGLHWDEHSGHIESNNYSKI